MKLYEPIQIGKMELNNRICMAPMAQSFNTREDGTMNDDHTPTRDLIDYYARRAAGGVGLVILEQTECNLESVNTRPYGIGLWDDRLIPGMSRLASAVHSYGAKVAPQLHIWGTLKYSPPSRVLIRPRRGTPWPPGPMELSEEGVWERIDQYSEAARRARDAGFDCVEFHGAHQHPLAAQFGSPHMNKRSDGWGGSTQNRARFAIEVIRRSKEKAGKDFPIIWRFSAVEFVDDGMKLEEAKVFARLLVEAGADALHVSGGMMSNLEHSVPPNLFPVGYHVPWAEAIKKEVNVPVIAVGGITSPRLAESILERGTVDLIAIGRPLFCDPDWARKGLEGRHKELRVCLRCNACFDLSRRGLSKCLLNPELGRKMEYAAECTRAIKAKAVLVVGGGPAGLEAARVAASRGHRVSLYEEKPRLGGHWSWLLKSYLPQKQRELEGLGVTLELGREVTSSLVGELKPDAIVVTEGARPIIPEIAGIEEENVFLADDVLAGKVEITGRALILGGTACACETAMYLSKKGLAVTMVEKGESVGKELASLIQPVVHGRLVEQGVEMLTNMEVTAIRGKRVTCLQPEGERTLEADSIVIALGYQTDRDLYQSLQDKAPEVYSVVHCEAPGDVMEAAEAGAAVARGI